MQVHDFNGTVSPSGLFWIVQVPDSALTVTGRTVRVQVDNVAVVDNFTFLGPNEVPATASFDITWTSFGKVQHYRPQSTDPTDPTNFAGEFRLAIATGSFSASESGFAFTSSPERNFSRNLRGDGNGTKRVVPAGMTWLPLGAVK